MSSSLSTRGKVLIGVGGAVVTSTVAYLALSRANRDAIYNVSRSIVQRCPLVGRLVTVNPIITTAAQRIVVVRKAYQNAPHRIAVRLRTDGVFDGTGTLSCPAGAGNIQIFLVPAGGMAQVLPIAGITGPHLTAGFDVYVEGATASGALNDITLTLTLNGGTSYLGAPASLQITAIELHLNICACRDHAVNAPAPLSAVNKINPGRNLHLQRGDLRAARARLVVGRAVPNIYAGNLVVRPLNNRVDAFANERDGAPRPPAVITTVNHAVIPNGGIPAGGQVYWVEGHAVSGGLRDTGFVVELQDLPGVEGDRVNATVIQLDLDIYQSRTAPLTPPAALSAFNKRNTGRFVQLRTAGHHHGRARLVVRKAIPHAFAGNIELKTIDNRVEAFTQEIPAGAQVAVARQGAPLVLANGAIHAVNGHEVWIDGALVSGALRDSGFRVKLEDATDNEHVTNDGDIVRVTVVEFTQIQATIHPSPSLTPANQTACAIAAPADHVFQSNHIDDDFTANPPLVLMRNAQPDIALVVTANPANLPIRWEAIRNPADHANLGAAAELPTLTADGGNAYQATLAADEKGSFRIRAYIDCNGNNNYDEREPSIPLNLVLANATLQADNCVAHPARFQVNWSPTWMQVKNGGASALATAGMVMEVLALVTGGGANGRLGLDKVFAGLVNVQNTNDISAVYQIPAGAAYTIRALYVSNPAQADSRLFAAAGEWEMFTPAAAHAPQVLAFPLLDSGRPAPGAGGETATMNYSGHLDPAPADAAPIGQTYTIRCVDSPGRTLPLRHPNHATAVLVALHYDQQFVANFCFWTNVNRSRPSTNHAAERVYCVLRTVPWSVLADWSVNAAAQTLGPAVPPNPYTFQIGGSATVNPIGRAQDNNVEVCAPSGMHRLRYQTT